MKKLLLSFGLFVTMLTITLPANAWGLLESIVQLELTDVYPKQDRPRTPVYIPQVGQIGYALYFHDETDFTVNLYSVDEDDNLTLEYTTFVPSTTESIALPSDFSGTYVIEVIRGSQHFEGEIEL